jgi:tetratricopeptide (TPR) repeat protein
MRVRRFFTIIITVMIGIAYSHLLFSNEKQIVPIDKNELSESKKLNTQALELFNKGDIKEAIEIWERASRLAIAPELGCTVNVEVSNNLGFAYYKLGNGHFPDAVKYLECAMIVNPKRWTVYLNLGDLYDSLNEQEKAISNYRKVLELKPDYKYADKLQGKISKGSTSVKLNNESNTQVDGLPINLGDTISDVKRKYSTNLDPVPNKEGYCKECSHLYLKSKGINILFNTEGKVISITLQTPFSGRIKGVKINDSKFQVESLLCTPAKKTIPPMSTRNAYLYYFDDVTTTKIDFDRSDNVEHIYLYK